MKKALVFPLLLVLLLSACSVKNRQSNALPTVAEELSTLRRQIDYYEARSAEL